jgi:hypothetical protein
MNIDQIVDWYMAKRTPALSQGDAVTLLNIAHPRTIFVKTLPLGATILDMGAGDGGLEVFRRWPPPPRGDLKMYAYSLAKGRSFEAYDGFELGNWDNRPPEFPGVRFTAIFCCHFIEHIADPIPFLNWAAEAIPATGRLYLEWPSPFSLLLPSKLELAGKGVHLTISNFGDDGTHKAVHDRSLVVSTLTKLGFMIEQQGIVSLPFLEDEIPAHAARGLVDAYAIQSAYWSKTKWAQYVVAARR